MWIFTFKFVDWRCKSSHSSFVKQYDSQCVAKANFQPVITTLNKDNNKSKSGFFIEKCEIWPKWEKSRFCPKSSYNHSLNDQTLYWSYLLVAGSTFEGLEPFFFSLNIQRSRNTRKFDDRSALESKQKDLIRSLFSVKII